MDGRINGKTGPGVLPSSQNPSQSIEKSGNTSSLKGEKIIDDQKETSISNMERKKLEERAATIDSGISTSSSVSDGENLLAGKNFPYSEEMFDNAQERLCHAQEKLSPQQFSYVKDSINKLEKLNDNYETLNRYLTSDKYTLAEKERLFIDQSGSMLPHIDDGTTSPEEALFAAKNLVESFFNLLYEQDISDEQLFNGFFDPKEHCFEARCRQAQDFGIQVNASILQGVAEYSHDMDSDTIFNNEVVAFQELNNMDPMMDVVSGADFKAYMMDKSEAWLNFKAKDGPMTEQVLDTFIDQQVNELMTMDP